MASMDKQSVREELDRLRQTYNDISRKEKMSPQIELLISGMMSLMEIIVSIFLEKKTPKTSANSSKSSSQTDKDNSSLTHKGNKTKGKTLREKLAQNTRTIETTTMVSVEQCEHCGKSLKNIKCDCIERRTKIDIVFEKVVTHVDAETKTCPKCNQQTKAKHPEDMPGKKQYGNGIKAYILHLFVAQMISLNRIQKMVVALIGEKIAEATVLSYVMRLHLALAEWEADAKRQLLKTKSLHVDETSLRVDKRNHWVHVYSSGDITLKYLHPKRGNDAIVDIDIIPQYKGVIIHDCWGSYMAYKTHRHGLCGSHLLRELNFIVESNNYRWARNMKKLLKETCHNVSKHKKKCLSQTDYQKLQRRYRNILTRGKKEMPVIPKKTNAKRGRIAKSDAHNLWERLKEHENGVLLFALNPHVSFTNNRAERDLRMDKVKQKVSGCFRRKQFAEAHCRISSYLQTMANKGLNPMIAIQMALDGKIDC